MVHYDNDLTPQFHKQLFIQLVAVHFLGNIGGVNILRNLASVLVQTGWFSEERGLAERTFARVLAVEAQAAVRCHGQWTLLSQVVKQLARGFGSEALVEIVVNLCKEEQSSNMSSSWSEIHMFSTDRPIKVYIRNRAAEKQHEAVGPTCAMGALTQAPRHSTSKRVNMWSGVVSPFLMPRWSQMVCLISSEPHAMHGVVPQSWMKYVPTFARLNIV